MCPTQTTKPDRLEGKDQIAVLVAEVAEGGAGLPGDVVGGGPSFKLRGSSPKELELRCPNRGHVSPWHFGVIYK